MRPPVAAGVSIGAGVIRDLLMSTVTGLFPDGWVHYLAGGLLIGAGIGLVFAGTGLVGGASSFFSATLSWLDRAPGFRVEGLAASRRWRLVYALGMVLGAASWWVGRGGAAWLTTVPAWQLALGGVIGGFGARLGGGCTSGHGVCGLGNLQLPSLVSVMVFLSTAALTAHLLAAVH